MTYFWESMLPSNQVVIKISKKYNVRVINVNRESILDTFSRNAVKKKMYKVNLMFLCAILP